MKVEEKARRERYKKLFCAYMDYEEAIVYDNNKDKADEALRRIYGIYNDTEICPDITEDFRNRVHKAMREYLDTAHDAMWEIDWEMLEHFKIEEV